MDHTEQAQRDRPIYNLDYGLNYDLPSQPQAPHSAGYPSSYRAWASPATPYGYGTLTNQPIHSTKGHNYGNATTATTINAPNSNHTAALLRNQSYQSPYPKPTLSINPQRQHPSRQPPTS